MLSKIGGRKVLFGLLFLTVGVTLAYTLGDVPKNLMEFMIFLSAGFFLGNGIEHGAEAIKSRQKKETDAVQKRLDVIQEQSAITAQGVATVQQALSMILDKAGMTKK